VTHVRRSWAVTAAVVALALAVRLVAWQRQPELGYDGTYYLRQAERLAHFDYDFVGFPPGYPLAIAIVRPLARDPVRAARLVSLVAGLATIVLVHRALAPALPPAWALGTAIVLALHPQQARADVETISEPLFGLLVVAALVWSARARFALACASLGVAFWVRPEAALPLAGLTLMHAIATRRVPWTALAGWVPVAVFALAASFAVGHPVLSPKQGQLDIDSDFVVRLRAMATAVASVFPWVVLPFVLWFAARVRRAWLWVALPPVLLPLAFAVHVQERLLLPALPFWIVLGAEWLQTLRPRLRVAAVVAAVAVFAPAAVRGARVLIAPEPLSPHAQALGTALRPYLRSDDRVSCRFPMIPYYGGAGFVRPRPFPYDAQLDSLRARGATHLLAVEDEMERALPQWARLFDDARFATAEGRLEPVARVDVGPGARAVLYRLAPPPITAVAVTAGVRGACWRGEVLVAAREDGDLHRVGADSTALVRTPQLELEPQAGAGAARVVLSQVQDDQRWIASLEDGDRLAAWPATAADDPASPADAGTHILYVRRRAPAGLRAVEIATGRIVPVQLAGLESDVARPLAVTARGRDIAITYQRKDATDPAARVVATALWPAQPAGSSIVLEGRWAVGVLLADDAACFVPGDDAVVITVRFGDGPAATSGLAVVRRDALLRRLSFGSARARKPQLAPGGRIAFLSGDATLQVGTLSAAALTTPAPLVFSAAPGR